MNKISEKGALIKKVSGYQTAILDFFQDLFEKNIFDAVMLPMKIPSGDSFAWIMIKDKKILNNAQPLAPIMPVNAAKALKRYTRKGKGTLKIAALMKPCEIRATVELTKLNQVNLDDVTLFSYDCVGAIPMQDYIVDPKTGDEKFEKMLSENNLNHNDVKPVCKICDNFSLSATDLHFGFNADKLFLVTNSKKGENLLQKLDLKAETDLQKWQKAIDEKKKKRVKKREETFKTVKTKVEGFSKLTETFADCIGCHNCQSSCPICYCRQCYFDTSAAKPNSDLVLMRAKDRGATSLPLDRIMFHTGRMAHMSLSCVSCGLCSDACPVNIPVAKIFSYVAAQTQETFEYSAGASVGDALPMKEYKLNELGELGEMVKSAEAQEGEHE